MPEHTPVLNLPLIQPSQAQKHVTHNEALVLLDSVAQLVLQRTDLAAPPSGAAEGDGYFIASGASGDWAGKEGELAFMSNGGWVFITPKDGWRAWDLGAAKMIVYSQGSWLEVTGEFQNLDGLGVGTSSDSYNKLAVAADAALFTHAGNGHQMKINKAGAGDTASVVFQSNWSGHAEMGLAGNTDFSIKVSPDGGSWSEALKINASTGHATGAAVQASATDFTSGRLARAEYTYGPGNLLGTVSLAGGMPTGAVLERGSSASGDYLRFADGTQMCMTDSATFTRENGSHLLCAWTPPAAFASGTPRYAQYTVSNNAADWSWVSAEALGALVHDPLTDDLRISRVAGAANFGSSAEVRNVRLVTWGRWA